jgi:hypothetical protein
MKYSLYIIWAVVLMVIYFIYQKLFGFSPSDVVEKNDKERILKANKYFEDLKVKYKPLLTQNYIQLENKAQLIYDDLNLLNSDSALAISVFGQFAKEGICTYTKPDLMYIYASFGIREIKHFVRTNQFLDLFSAFKQADQVHSEYKLLLPMLPSEALTKIYKFTGLIK